MTETLNKPPKLALFRKPKVIIFVLCLIAFLVSLNHVAQIDRDIRASGFAPGHWSPGAAMREPSLLLLAALSLLINRWWTVVLATIGSAHVIYALGYQPLRAVHLAQDIPMFSWQAMEKVWYLVYETRTEYLFEIALAFVILGYAVFESFRLINSRSNEPVTATSKRL